MFTAASIRRHINNFTDDKPFSIREFLNYGSRAAVDQTFFRLVKSGEIIRIARGLFIKCMAPSPSVLEVAEIKAAAFGKKIVIHGKEFAYRLGLVDKNSHELFYACSGRTSSFQFGNVRIHLIGVSPRKMYLKDSPAGLAVRVLWHFGRTECNAHLASLALLEFNRLDRKMLRQSRHAMPSWMCDFISFMKR